MTEAAPQTEDSTASMEDQAAAVAEAAEAAAAAKGAKVADKLVHQVEFYFSDENLPTDTFMIKQVTSNVEGWVGVNVICQFKKVKNMKLKLSKVVEILRTSIQLEVSDDGKRVRRVAPLPELGSPDAQERTVIAENLPKDHTIESLTALFNAVGTVKTLRVCDAAEAQTSKQAVSNKEHALVEFAEVASAVRAVRELTDDKNWRSGLRVKHMLAVPPGSKEAKLAAAKQKATLKAAKLLEELQLQAEGAEGGTPAGASGADEGGAVEAGEVKAAKARQTREEVEALVAAGKLYATVRTQLCKAFSQGIACKHGIKCFYAHGETELRDTDGGAQEKPARKTTVEVEALVAQGKLPATARMRLCRHFAQGLQCVHDLKCHFAHGEAELREGSTVAEECEGNDVATSEFRAAGRKGKGKKDYAAWASAGAWKESQAKEGGGEGSSSAEKAKEGSEGGQKAREARPRRLMLQPRTMELPGGSSIQAVLSSGAGKEPVKPDGGKGFTRGRGKSVAGSTLPEALLLVAPGSAPTACADGEVGHKGC